MDQTVVLHKYKSIVFAIQQFAKRQLNSTIRFQAICPLMSLISVVALPLATEQFHLNTFMITRLMTMMAD